MAVVFGPGGNSQSFYDEGHKHTWEAPEWVAGRGLELYEYQGGNGIVGSEENFRKIGERAKAAGVTLSLHAPYFISLSGLETEKRLNSLNYIRKSLDAARWMGADIIVIHTGSAAKMTREEAMRLASDTLYKACESLDGYDGIAWGLETMGKVNQLGTVEEVLELCKLDARLRPVVDYGHLNARNLGGLFTTADDYRRLFDKLGDYTEKLHCHFSKIEYTKAGEKKHLTFADTVWGPPYEPLMEAAYADGLNLRIICESDGTMAEDAAAMQRCYRQMQK